MGGGRGEVGQGRESVKTEERSPLHHYYFHTLSTHIFFPHSLAHQNNQTHHTLSPSHYLSLPPSLSLSISLSIFPSVSLFHSLSLVDQHPSFSVNHVEQQRKQRALGSCQASVIGDSFFFLFGFNHYNWMCKGCAKYNISKLVFCSTESEHIGFQLSLKPFLLTLSIWFRLLDFLRQ